MFDIGFWELCLIAVVALLVLGPERLPVAARTAGKWIGKIRGMVSSVKEEIDRELQLEEIRSKMAEQEKQLKEQSGLNDFQSAIDQTIADMEPIERTASHLDSSEPEQETHKPAQEASLEPATEPKPEDPLRDRKS